jgi:hypothetical protein
MLLKARVVNVENQLTRQWVLMCCFLTVLVARLMMTGAAVIITRTPNGSAMLLEAKKWGGEASSVADN